MTLRDCAHAVDLASLLAQARIATRPTASNASQSVRLSGIAHDSRSVRSDDLFVAIKGTKCDGHQHIRQAIDAGACAILLSNPAEADPRVPCLIVDDTADALARLSAVFLGLHALQSENQLTIIGVTGTNGKSTTCHLIHNILQAAGLPAALLGTIQYDLLGRKLSAPWTTPPAQELIAYLLESSHHGARYAVMEVSSHALHQKRTSGVQFKVAVFTNLTGDHMDYHQDRENYLQAKKLLFDSLGREGVAVTNLDDSASTAMVADCRGSHVTYGMTPQSDVSASRIDCSVEASRFTLHRGDTAYRVAIPLVGKHNISNALAAACVGYVLGIDSAAIKRGLEATTTIRGRLQRTEPPGHPFHVFVDYAHTDDALANVLSALKPLTRGRLWCVFGCGGDRDRSKRPRMASVAERYADHVVVTSDNPRSEPPMQIIKDIVSGLGESNCRRVIIEPDRRQAIERALSGAAENDVVLIAGKGHENYQLVGPKKLSFDDARVVHDYFSCKGGLVREAPDPG